MKTNGLIYRMIMQKVIGMNHRQYEEYLRSNAWKQKREARLKIDNYRCCACGAEGTPEQPLQVHHMRYNSMPDEDVLKELVTLCKPCHRLIHKMMCRRTGTNFDGSPRYGWRSDIPSFIRADLKERDLVD